MSDNLVIKSYVKSIWVGPWENEKGAPQKRIIHCRYAKLKNVPESIRVGVKLGDGYFKCGSEKAVDWVEEFAAYSWENGNWVKILYAAGIKKPKKAEDVVWFELRNTSKAYFFEVRRSGIDGWWPCWNIAESGFIIEARGRCGAQGKMEIPREIDVTQAKTEACDSVNTNGNDELNSHPKRRLHRVKFEPGEGELSAEDISVTRTSASIRYQSPFYSIGFRLKSAGLDFLSFDGAGTGKVYDNLLAMGAMLLNADDDFFTQGPVINPVDAPSICGFLSYDIEGSTEVSGNSLLYSMYSNKLGLAQELKFTMGKNSIRIDMKRKADKNIKLLDSSPFRIAFNSKKTPLTALGSVIMEGETGAVTLPLTLHLPGYAGIRLEGAGTVQGRFNSIRPRFVNTFGFELAGKLSEDGCYLIEKGDYKCSVTMTIGFDHHLSLDKNTPEHIQQAFGRYVYTSLPYRADTATFSNNGNSMGAPICLDNWADLCELIGKGPYGVDSMQFLKNTIEIHLLGAPAYASGVHYSGEYEYEDEYLMTGTAILLGIAKYLDITGSREWYELYKDKIVRKIRAMKARDIDNDGLAESVRRRGNYGEHQWSTCWYDVISYGYKDAYSNALLYPALQILSRKTAEYGDLELSQELTEWAGKIEEVYVNTFMTENGWLAGWRCMKGELHDYGFLAVNGAAVSYGLLKGEQAKTALAGLWKALLDNGFDSFDMGLPGNIYDIDNGDMAEVQHILPFGGYQNGGVTLSQSRHFINGMYIVGMVKEADYILSEICKGLLYGNLIGGVGSGVDWKTWDGVASGYEGLLCDQLGIFQPLINRYGKKV